MKYHFTLVNSIPLRYLAYSWTITQAIIIEEKLCMQSIPFQKNMTQNNSLKYRIMIEVSDTITDIHIDRNVNNIDNLVINWTFGMTICVHKITRFEF